jgi:hypothetical protein
VANVFGADYFKVRWTFLNNFHHPRNLQEKHMMVNTVHTKKQKKEHSLGVTRSWVLHPLLTDLWLWSCLNFCFLSCKEMTVSTFIPVPHTK